MRNINSTPTNRAVITIVLSVSLLMTGCDTGSGEFASLGTLERDRIELTVETSEPVRSIFVKEGEQVKTNQTLLQQDTSRAEVALERARADEAVIASALKAAEAGPRQQEIAAARARLEAADSALTTVRIELERAQSLVARKLTSQNQVDVLQGNYNTSLAGVQEAQAALGQLLEGTRSEDIDQARSRHSAAKAVVSNLEITLDRAAIRAPVPGLIEALPFEIGERPTPGATVVVMLASGRTYARVHVSEPIRTRLTVGDPAEVRIDGYAAPFTGQLSWISSSAAFTPYFALNQHDRSRLSYVAEIDLTETEHPLPVGVPVEVTFPGLAK